MEDMQQMAVAIRSDSLALQEWREKLPENRRPKTLAELEDMHRGILVFVEKNNYYQRTMDRFRHEQNARARGQGDKLVRPAWEAKTGTREFPWPFNTNLAELIKIFHHCWVPLLADLHEDLTQASRRIERSLVSGETTGEIQAIRAEMSRIAAVFHWLQEHSRITYLDQVDTSGKEHQRSQEVPPGIPQQMEKSEKLLSGVGERQTVLEEKWRGGEANRISKRAMWISGLSMAIAVGSLLVSILRP